MFLKINPCSIPSATLKGLIIFPLFLENFITGLPGVIFPPFQLICYNSTEVLKQNKTKPNLVILKQV